MTKKNGKDGSTISGRILSSLVKEITSAMNISPDRLTSLLSQQLEKVERDSGKKIDKGKIRSRVGSKLESFNNDTTTFKSLLDFFKAIRVPKVVLIIELHANKPKLPMIFKRTLNFSDVPIITNYERKNVNVTTVEEDKDNDVADKG